MTKGANASVEGGAALGGTGVQSAAGGAVKQETNDRGKNAKPEKRAKRKQERD